MNGTSTFLQACENLCGGLFFCVEGSDEYENVEWLVGPDLLSDASKIPTITVPTKNKIFLFLCINVRLPK